jgi:L-fuconolactonase
MPQKIIDTHVHLWQLDQSSYDWLKAAPALLQRNYSIEELEADRTAAGITGGILVQADNTLEDTEWMLATAARTGWISGVVGWLPLTDPVATATLLADKYARHPYFKGVRHLIHDEADPKWLLQDTVIESLQLLAQYQLPYDLVGVLPEHIETALQVAEKVPGLRMIFDHLNQPPIAAKERFGRWGALMQEAAGHENFYVKISGMGTTAGSEVWSANTIRPYIEFVLQHFGEDRCCCGGDWPVSLLAGSYTYTWTQYREVLAQVLKKPAQEKLYYGNAALFYNV